MGESASRRIGESANQQGGKQPLPDGWELVPVRDVFEIHYGKGLVKSKRDGSGKVPVYGSSGILGRHTQALVDTPCIVVGRKGAVGEVHLSKVPCWPIDTTYYIQPPKELSSEYLYYALGFMNLGTLDKSTAIPGLNRDDFYSQTIPIPPYLEQHRIVDEIETQFTRLEAGAAALERAQANLRRYKAAVLKAACEGRLVPTEAELARAEGRDYEPADQLLARILAEQRAKWEAEHPGKRHKEPAPPDTEDLPQLPEGWAYALVEPLLSTTRPGMKTGPFGSLLKKHEHQPKGVPVLGIENIGPTGYVPGNKIFITEEKADQLSKYDVQSNDILISRSGTVGEVCTAPEGLGKARFSTNLMRIVLAPNGMLPKFFRFLFNGSPFVLDQVSELCSGSTRDFLNQKILKSVVFPVPPLAEQRRIVAEVERRLSVVAALEREVEAALARAGRLRQSVLKRAFEGRLVAQNPDDEPAAVLLERIKEEREAEEKGRGSKKKADKSTKQLQLPLD